MTKDKIDIKDYVSTKIKKNNLPLNVDECLNIIKQYRSMFDGEDDIKLFYRYILNRVGQILVLNTNEDISELLGWLRIRGRNSIIFYEFETEEDYFEWLNVRKLVYSKLDNDEDIRLLNYLELSTMNFIHDIYTKCNYTAYKGDKLIQFKKNEFSVDVDDSVSFIQYIAKLFNNDYNFMVI